MEFVNIRQNDVIIFFLGEYPWPEQLTLMGQIVWLCSGTSLTDTSPRRTPLYYMQYTKLQFQIGDFYST
jgi:hypothetical protein